jgi:hypothetical protein
MSLAKLFLYLDIFGGNFVFLTKNQEKYRTGTGALLTILYALILVMLFIQFGVDLYERKNPKVSTNIEVVPYEPYALSNANFTFAYRVEDLNGNIFLDETVVYPKYYTSAYKVINGSWSQLFLKSPANRRCHDFPDYKKKEAYYNISLASWYCIDFDNFTWGGNWDGNFVNYFQVNIQQCMNSTENNNHCANQKNMSESFINDRTSGNLFYSQLFLSAVPAMDNYDQPLKTSLVNTYSLLNMQLSKRRVQTYKNTVLKQDIGWFWKDIRYEDVLDIDTSEPDFTFKDQWKQGILFSTYNYLGSKRQVYSRSYTKIQEVIANIGGFAKFAHTCIAIIFMNIKITYKNLFFMENFEKIKEPISNYHITKDNKTIVIDRKLSYYEYLCIKVCRSRSNGKLKKSYKYYEKIDANFKDKLDIVTYMKIFNHLDILMKAPPLLDYLNETGKILKTQQHTENHSPKKKIMFTPMSKNRKTSYGTMEAL